MEQPWPCWASFISLSRGIWSTRTSCAGLRPPSWLPVLWAGHGLKDMAVKEVRRSIALLDMVNADQGVDTGLIRDVLLNQDAYKEFLVHAYESAWEDGVITEAELKELKSFQKALGISDEEAADLNVKAAIKSAAADGEITDEEAKSIETAAKAAKMSDEDTAKAVSKQLEKTTTDQSQVDSFAETNDCASASARDLRWTSIQVAAKPMAMPAIINAPP